MTMQQYCLRWNNHQPNFISVFSSLLNSESLVDVTLAAEGRHLQAHKVVLSACSSYFQSLFTINPCQHPIVILKDVKFVDLKVMVDFMYYGEVNVSQEQLPHILKTAEMLKIKGLAEIPVEQSLTKAQNTSTDRADLLTPGESNWSSEGVQRRSVSPTPCPLSPSSRRKRLRKSSTGSGSGSTERTSEELPSSEVTLTSSSGSILGTVIKTDPGFVSECSTPSRSKQHSSDSELHRGSSHESMEGEAPHHITLQVPQQQEMTHSLESTPPDASGPSSSQAVTGIQWGFMDHSYPHFNAYQQTIPVQTETQCNVTNSANYSNANTVSNFPPNNISTLSQQPQNHIPNSPPQIMQKRKRSVNPQADENFVRALEAVRFGGIGFCKAARIYGVNNRTLWLEYKKRGYPTLRMSIKSRNGPKQNYTSQQQHQRHEQPQPESNDQQQQHTQTVATSSSSIIKHDEQTNVCSAPPSQPVALISSTFLEGRHVDVTPMLQRPRYVDASVVNQQQSVSYQGISFEQV